LLTLASLLSGARLVSARRAVSSMPVCLQYALRRFCV
jgi:hypothetical protein